MGLDMFLYGKKLPGWSGDRAKDDEGFIISSVNVELAYWRKHPNLHGFIVETFENGEDNCQPIELCEDDIETIIEAIRENNLPDTVGFFYGKSPTEGAELEAQKAEDIEIFTKALAWLKNKKQNEYRIVVYQASW